MKDNPEQDLLYADVVLRAVTEIESGIEVKAEAYDQSCLSLYFNEASIIKFTEDCPEIVDAGQHLKLKNGRQRLILFNDEKKIFFEIEFSECVPL